jgi:hypothetical protein
MNKKEQKGAIALGIGALVAIVAAFGIYAATRDANGEGEGEGNGEGEGEGASWWAWLFGTSA